METNKILNADVLDIIFDGKNKQYGAYELRKTYNSRLTKALLLTAAFALLIFLTSVLANVVGKKSGQDLEVLDTQMAEVKKDVPPPPPPPPPPPQQPPPPPVNQIKFTPPKIVKDEEVKPEEKIEEIDKQKISDVTIKSDVQEEVKPQEIDNSNAQAEVKTDNEDQVFTKVENEAEFPGGNGAWARYLEKALGGFNPADNGAAPGKYQVIVRFIVSKDGSISDVQPETSFGSGMEEQAVKCIRNGPRWKPALQNGRNVNAYRRQPVTFIVEEQ